MVFLYVTERGKFGVGRESPGREGGVGKIREKEAGDEGSTGVKETLKNLL